MVSITCRTQHSRLYETLALAGCGNKIIINGGALGRIYIRGFGVSLLGLGDRGMWVE